jgi:diketogulonate reductase-like aldo/keto reductase
VPLSNLQVELHPYFPQRQLVAFCHDRGIAVTGYSPLANNNHIFRKDHQPMLLDEPTVKVLAEKHAKVGHCCLLHSVLQTPAQIVLRWFIQRGLVVIPKSVTASRIEDNFRLFDFVLTDDDMHVIDALDCNMRITDLSFRDKDHPHFPFNEPF